MGVAEKIEKAFEEMQVCCEMIEGNGKCDKCPMSVWCLKDDTIPFGEAVYNMSLDTIKKFIATAEKLSMV